MKDFIKFCALILELQLPQNFCHTHIDTHKDTQINTQTEIFQKLSNPVQDIPKSANPSKPGNRKFALNNTLFYIYRTKLCSKKHYYILHGSTLIK